MTERPTSNQLLSTEYLSPEQEKQLEQATLNLFTSLIDLETTLLEHAISNVNPQHLEAEQTRSNLGRLQDALYSLQDSSLSQINTFPRTPRTQDRTQFIPGQHKGLAVQLVQQSGTITIINVYGGLRTFTGSDLHDSFNNSQHGKAHADRTDHVLSQPTQLNIHMLELGIKQLDCWSARRPNGEYALGTTILGNQNLTSSEAFNHSPIPPLKPTDYQYQSINQRLTSSLQTLTKLIPSAN